MFNVLVCNGTDDHFVFKACLLSSLGRCFHDFALYIDTFAFIVN